MSKKTNLAALGSCVSFEGKSRLIGGFYRFESESRQLVWFSRALESGDFLPEESLLLWFGSGTVEHAGSRYIDSLRFVTSGHFDDHNRQFFWLLRSSRMADRVG